MTYEAFKGYVADVLARLIKLCAEKPLPVQRGEAILAWAKDQSSTIWDSFEAGEDVRDVATALYLLSVASV